MSKKKHNPALLVVGAPDVVAHALRQVFTLFGFYIVALDFKSDTAAIAIRTFSTAIYPVPVIVGSVRAWESLRSVNLWLRTRPFVQWNGRVMSSIGSGQPDDVSEKFLAAEDYRKQEEFKAIVLPAIALAAASPYNAVVSGGIGLSNLVPRVLQECLSVRYELALWRHYLSLATLRLFKEDYHPYKPANAGTDGHREVDFHGALRLLHGAALGGGILPDEWLAASNGVLKASRTSAALWEKSSPFYREITKWLIPGRVELEKFGTLLVVDDEQFWSESLRPMWEKCGIRIERTIAHESRTEITLPATVITQPIRAIFLNLKIGNSGFQGVKLLRKLKEKLPDVPIIVLSVQDHLSLANLLKRQGVFANISKQSSAEERGCRDELCAIMIAAALAMTAKRNTSLG